MKIYDRILFIAFALYVVSTLISMATMSIGAGVLGAAILIHAFANGAGHFFKAFRSELSFSSSRMYLVASGALTIACALSLIVARIWPLQYMGKGVEVHFGKDLAKAWYLFWPFILVVALRWFPPEKQKKLIKIWVSAFGVLSIIGILQHFTGWPRPQGIPGHESNYHVTLFLGHHLSVASILIFPFFFALEFFRSGDRKMGIWAFFGLLALFGTYSRTLWVALPLSILVWMILVLPKRQAGVLTGLFGLSLVGAWQLPFIRARFLNSMGISTRQELWEANWNFFQARPLTGTGWHHNLDLASHYFEAKGYAPGHFVGHAHNNLLEMLGSTGLLGTLTWLFWCGLAIVLALRGRSQFRMGLICAWIAFHINGLTQVNFWESKVLHQISWVMALTLLFATSHSKKITLGETPA